MLSCSNNSSAKPGVNLSKRLRQMTFQDSSLRVQKERILVRIFALYFCFLSKPSLSALASELREKEIYAKRKAFRLDQFSNYYQMVVDNLAKAGTVSTYQMIGAAVHPKREKIWLHVRVLKWRGYLNT